MEVTSEISISKWTGIAKLFLKKMKAREWGGGRGRKEKSDIHIFPISHVTYGMVLTHSHTHTNISFHHSTKVLIEFMILGKDLPYNISGHIKVKGDSEDR